VQTAIRGCPVTAPGWPELRPLTQLIAIADTDTVTRLRLLRTLHDLDV
jgi:hypothetical protein